MPVGYGYGYGYGSKEYWQATLPYFEKKWPADRRLRLDQLRAEGKTIAFWKSDADGRACNGGRHAVPVAPGTVEEIAGPLHICTRNALHATHLPPKWDGARMWVVALFGEIQSDGDKLGALKREIIGECL